MAWTQKRQTKKGEVRYRGGYRDPEGKATSAGTFDTKSEALRAALLEEQKVANETWMSAAGGKDLLGPAITQWADTRGNVRDNTRAGAMWAARVHIVPNFGGKAIAALRPAELETWMDQARAGTHRTVGGRGPLGERSLEAVLRTLGAFYADLARNRKYEGPCPVRAISRMPNGEAKAKEVMTPSQCEAAMGYLIEHEPWWVPTGLLLFDTGCRWGMAAGLEPKHFDVAGRKIRFEQVLVELTKRTSRGGERFTIKPTMKDGRPHGRSVLVSAQTIDLLSKHAADHGFPFVVMTRTGRHPSRGTFRKVWKAAVTAAGCPDVTVHGARHAMASWLLAAGASPSAVQERLGHHRLTTTLDTYGHSVGTADEQARDLMEGLMPTLPNRQPPAEGAEGEPRR